MFVIKPYVGISLSAAPKKPHGRPNYLCGGGPPEDITPPTITSSATANFAENASGTVLTVTADEPLSSYVLSGTDAADFNIDGSGNITFVSTPNFESPDDADANNIYLFDVTVEDLAENQTLQSLTITVTDVNDIAPVVDSPLTFGVSESISDSITIGVVTFTDVDTVNGTTVYAIVADTDDLFEIDSSGNISLQSGKNLDYETKTSHTIDVTVNDGVNTSASQLVTINVSDVNEAPTDISLTSNTVDEESAIGTSVGTLSATDEDLPADTLTYSLVAGAGDTDNSSFQIVGSDLQTNAVLNHEAQSAYSILIEVSDGALTYTEIFTINTIDINEAPEATNLTSTSNYNEGDPSVAITDIVVTDVDAGETIIATLTLADVSTGVLTTSGSATYNSGTGVWEITGTVANVNTALAALSFTPVVDNTTDTTISVGIDDGDEDSSGPLTGTITLDVTAAASPETLSVNSATFDGVNQAIGADSRIVPAGDYTVSIWFKVNSSVASQDYIFAAYDTGKSDPQLAISYTSAGDLIIDMKKSNGQTILATQDAISTGTWYNVQIVHDLSTKDAWYYLDGTQKATAGYNGGAGSSDNAYFGAREESGSGIADYSDCDIAYFNVVNEAHDQATVTKMVNSGVAICPTEYGSKGITGTVLSNYDLGNTGTGGNELTDNGSQAIDLTNTNSTPFTGTGLSVWCTP